MPEASSARDPQPGSAQALKAYHPPTLRDLGTVADLTRTDPQPLNNVVLDAGNAGYVNAS